MSEYVSEEEREIYEAHFAQLAALCRQFVLAHEDENTGNRLLLCGMLIAQLAAIYNLDVFGGLLDPRSLFVARRTLPTENEK